MPANLENSAEATGLEMSVFITIPKKGNVKECSNYHTIALISQTSKVMLKILQARLEQYMNQELPDVQAGFRKGRGTRDQIANIHWITEKARDFQKTSTSALLTMPKPLTVWITTNCGKFFKRWEYLKRLLRNLYAGQEATEMDKWTMDWFQIRKEVHQGYILLPCLFNLDADDLNGWLNKLESSLPGEISITSDRKMTGP